MYTCLCSCKVGLIPWAQHNSHCRTHLGWVRTSQYEHVHKMQHMTEACLSIHYYKCWRKIRRQVLIYTHTHLNSADSPRCKRNWTIWSCPWIQAMCKALFPSLSALVIEASKSNSSLRQLWVCMIHSVNCVDTVAIYNFIIIPHFTNFGQCYKLLHHIYIQEMFVMKTMIK